MMMMMMMMMMMTICFNYLTTIYVKNQKNFEVIIHFQKMLLCWQSDLTG